MFCFVVDDDVLFSTVGLKVAYVTQHSDLVNI